MADASGIKSVLSNWPGTLPRRGVAMTKQGEQLIFSNFSLGHGCVLWERATPDSMGGRLVIVPLDEMAAIKLTETPEPKTLVQLGFTRPGEQAG